MVISIAGKGTVGKPPKQPIKPPIQQRVIPKQVNYAIVARQKQVSIDVLCTLAVKHGLKANIPVM